MQLVATLPASKPNSVSLLVNCETPIFEGGRGQAAIFEVRNACELAELARF